MQHRQLGKSDLMVSEIGLGCNNFGFIANMDLEASRSVIYKAIDSGINFFDTSDSYGTSENILGEVLGPRRKNIILATKVGARTNALGEKSGTTRGYILAEAEESLRRLKTEWIDLYQIHYPDPKTPIEETLRALDDLVRHGKVRYIGCSNFSGTQLEEAENTAKKHDLHQFVSSQDEYSLLARELEHDRLPVIERLGVSELPYFPLASGMLTGKHRRGQPAAKGTRLADKQNLADRYLHDANHEKVERLQHFAREHGHSLLELAFSWLLAHRAVASVIAGATKAEQIEANAQSAGWMLTEEEMAEVHRITDAKKAGS